MVRDNGESLVKQEKNVDGIFGISQKTPPRCAKEYVHQLHSPYSATLTVTPPLSPTELIPVIFSKHPSHPSSLPLPSPSSTAASGPSLTSDTSIDRSRVS